MNSKKIIQIFKQLHAANPHPTTELIWHSPFELLIAVILSAQATDISVNRATEKLFAIANTPEKIVALGETGLKNYIKTIGLFNNKAKNIIATCKILIQKFNSTCPTSREALEALPGVGRKTANVILNTCFGEPTIAVDTHIFRVAKRIGFATKSDTTPLAVEKKLLQIIPKKFLHDAHHWLILHGRYICKARKPECESCIINKLCEFPEKNLKK